MYVSLRPAAVPQFHQPRNIGPHKVVGGSDDPSPRQNSADDDLLQGVSGISGEGPAEDGCCAFVVLKEGDFCSEFTCPYSLATGETFCVPQYPMEPTGQYIGVAEIRVAAHLQARTVQTIGLVAEMTEWRASEAMTSRKRN